MQEPKNNNTDNNKQSQDDKAIISQLNASSTKENIEAAHKQADADIAKDADLNIHSPNDDLDEGETARLGESSTDLV